MLINRQHLEGIASGAITLAFRRWKRPTVRAGGRLRTPIGVLAIDGVERIMEKDITQAEARRAGFTSRKALIENLRARTEGELYRIELHLSGPDPRTELRKRSRMTSEEVVEVTERLARYDTVSPRGAWTGRMLRLIADNPGTRAADLADLVDCEKRWLKAQVRKLKELGLTESLEIGYRLSPRGRAYLRAVGKRS